uniref:3-hydroxyacyl-CoA dehydrogenase type-2-like n=1 Tax=Phallusia mammillata TaxID=59560 RepID=A0A6F9DFD8_9ASCI|nr:3-hydroxyacyl-CoA dehydrogenase type-2-like [Phallusia mammillata]
MIDLKGKVALVTGGASGLGKATAQRLINNGCKVAILDLPSSAGEKVATQIGLHVCMFCPCDVTSVKDVENAMDQIVTHWGRLDIAVNCAGMAALPQRIYHGLTKEVYPLSEFERNVNVNLNGTFNVCRLAAKEMAKNPPGPSGERGVIVNTASIAAYDGQIGTLPYSAAKGGVASMTLPMARDLAVCGIRVIAVAPGSFDTPMAQAGSEKSKIRNTEDIVFPRRYGQPDEFAHLVQSSVENQMLNGCVIRIDGGQRLQIGDRKTQKEMTLMKSKL